MAAVILVRTFGNNLMVEMDDGSQLLAVPTGGSLWRVTANTGGGIDPGDGSLIDNILPGHVFAEGSLLADWQWHLDNANNRGGSDLNYAYGEPIYAPGAGTLSHFDVEDVGQVIKLVLDVPAIRTKPQFAYDQLGPMVAVWFQHTSESAPDGHVNQGDYIGKGGDGYGDYPTHLHVHGLIDTGNVASNANRCCFWNFV